MKLIYGNAYLLQKISEAYDRLARSENIPLNQLHICHHCNSLSESISKFEDSEICEILRNIMGLRKKVIIGISVILLLLALYIIINDIIRKSPDDGAIPCCDLVQANHGNSAKRT